MLPVRMRSAGVVTSASRSFFCIRDRSDGGIAIQGDEDMRKARGAGIPAASAAGFGRRSFLRRASASSATMALLAAARTALPAGAFAQASGPEVKGTKLGYIALTDASPLI